MQKITNQKDLRKAFWRDFEGHPIVSRKKLGGDYTADTRMAWVDYIDCLCREGQISENLADRATLQ